MSNLPTDTLADRADRDLVRSALGGSRESLDEIVRRHQGFIYSLAVRMLWEPSEAEDATQEILVKIVTALSSYRGDSAFRTWAYRVAANHLLTMNRGKVEQAITGFECYGGALDATPADEVPDELALPPDAALLAEEVKIGCTMGMLLCLDREQRLVFVLGEILEATDVAGAEILGLSRANFRQKLARARNQLYGFMAGKCGLADPENPCRCARKTRGFIRAGIVDPASLRFAVDHVARLQREARSRARALGEQFDQGLASVYRQPLRAPRDLVASLRSAVEGGALRRLLELDSQQSDGR